MRRYSYALTLLLLTQGAALLAQTPVVVSAQRQAQIKQAYLDLPLSFERQGDGANERYVARGNGYLVGLDKGRVVIELPAAGTSAKDSAGKLLSLDFTGGQPARAVPEGELAGKVNRYRGGDRNRWQTGLSTYSRVTYKDVYPGIDVVYYGNQQQLEFDFVVKPGADPGAIRMKVGGARDLKIDEAGALVIDEGGRKLKIALPAVYQDIVSQNGKGGRKKIAGRYKLRGSGEVAFALDSWDRTQPLVIDPTLVYSALIDGGTSSAFGNAIAVDGSGNIYLAGYTYATDFPTVNAAQPGPASAPDGFVTKINSSGTALIFSTFLGGSSTDYLTGVAYDSTGAAWVTGYTVSTDFPLMNATQSSYGGTGDAVVAKLGATGALQFSTYLGGTGYEYGYGIAVDSANNAYVTGVTESSNFPTTSGALQTTISSGENAYVTKFGSTGTLVYSTFFGGTSGETGTAIAVDSTGSAYITGYSASLTVNGQPGGGAQPMNAGAGDAYVAKLNPAGSALTYFTFLGGTNTDSGEAIALDSSKNAYVTGYTRSTGLATSGAAQSSLAGGQNAFIAKLNAAGSAFSYITYLGGNRQDWAAGIGVDSSGNAFVGGYTDSNAFPNVAALQATYPGNPISLFQTTTTGSSWSAFDTAIPGAVMDISADPVTSGIILAATENGLFRTTNNGTSWTQISALSGGVNALARSPVTPTTIYAFQPDNVYISTDDGVTWTYQGSPTTYFSGLVADPLAVGTVYGYSTSGVFVSTNSGVTFTAANTGLPSADVPALVATADGTLYASSYGSGIYKSTNHGTNWVSVNNSPLISTAYVYSHALAASGNTVYLAENGVVYVTTNGGTTWAGVAGSVPGGAYVVGVSPTNSSLVYASSYVGSGGALVYVSTNGGTTFNAANSGLGTATQVTEFAFDPLNASRAFVVAPVSQEAFVAELNAAGSSITYSTWFGGAGGGGTSEITGLAATAAGTVYATGFGSSGFLGGAFPLTTSAFDGQPTYGGAFVAEISPNTAACSVAITPGSQTIPGTPATYGLGVIAPSGCAWNATSNQSWATVTRGTGDSGVDTITVQVAMNVTGATRSATITAGSTSATLVQADATCSEALSQYNPTVPAAGQALSIGVTASFSSCPWMVTNPYPAAITVTSGASGNGNGTVNLTVNPYFGTSSQVLSVQIGNSNLYITQQGNCSYTLSPTSASYSSSGGLGFFNFTASSSSCQWNATSNNSWITITSATSGTGSGEVMYSVAADSGGNQSGSITIGSATFPITQTGAGVSITSNSNLGTYSIGQVEIPLTASGGSGTYTWSLVSGTLPTGMFLTNIPGTGTGQIGLVGIATTPGTYSFSLMVTDGTTSQTQAFTTKITAFTLKDLNLPDAFVGTAYSYTFTSLNGTATYAATSPALPNGMSLSSAGVLSGTPTTSGTYTVNFTISNSTDTLSRGFTLTIYAVDITTSGVLPNVTRGVAYSTTLAASGGSGGYHYTMTGGLPSGLSMTTAGVISGTVGSNAGQGLYSIQVTVTDSSSNSYQKTLAIDLIDTPEQQPEISTNTIDDAVLGVQYGWQISTCCGGAAPFTWTASGLPPGMSLRTGSGVTTDYIGPGNAELWGVPTAAGNYNVTVTATDSQGLSASIVIPFHVSTISLGPSYSLQYSGQGTINTSYTATFQIIGGTGTGYAVTQVAGYLPDGLSLNTNSISTGNYRVSGTPLENGGFDPIFRITDSANSLTRNNYFNVNNTGSGISIGNGTPLGPITTGSSYSNQLNACCVSSYVWSVVSGNLPAGMTLSSGGLLSGTPSVSGIYTFLVKAADSLGVAPAGFRQFVMNVTPLVITTGSLSYGNVGTSYSQSLAATGGTGSLTWSLVPGYYLPPGLTLSSGGTLSGVPTASGQFVIGVTVTDSSSHTTTFYYNFNIYPAGTFPPLSITTSSNLGTIHLGTNQIALSASGGNGTYTWSLVSGTLPTGLALRSDVPTYFSSTQQAGLIGVATVGNTYSFTLQVASGSQTALQAFTITTSALDLQDVNPQDGFVGVSYTHTFTPLGAQGGVTFTVNSASTNGQMPPGLTLSSAGVLSGTPTTAGAYNVAMNIYDGVSLQLDQYTLYIYAVDITTSGTLPNGTVSGSYSTTLAASGGAGGYTWSSNGGLPAGLTLSSAGTISGTITAGQGNYGFAVTATDSSSNSYSKNMAIDVVASPVTPMEITTRTFNDPVLGDRYGTVQTVCCGGTAPFTWTVTGLPPGLTTQANSNSYFQYPSTPGSVQIYGVPQTAGNYNVQFTVTDATSATTTLTVPMHVSPLNVSLTGNGSPVYGLPNGTIGTPYGSVFRVLGGTGPYTAARTANGALPSGISLGGSGNLTLSGTPVENGSFNQPGFTFGDSAGNSLSRYESIYISGGTSTISINGQGYNGYNLGTTKVGASYSTTFSACCTGSYVWSVASGSVLPAGLTLNSSTGTLSGTPTTAGNYSFLIDAAQSGNLSNVGVKLFTLTVTPISITSAAPTYGIVGTAYSQTLTTSGASGAVTWTQTYSELSLLPPGLTLSSGGVISGTPTSAGAYSVIFQGTDGSGNTVLVAYTIDIYQTSPPLNLPLNVSAAYAIGPNQLQIPLVATGGVPPYHYSLTPAANVISGMRVQDGQPLPAGFTAANEGGFLGLLGPGSYSTSIRVTDSTNATFDRAISFSVLPVDVVSVGTLPAATVGTAYSYQLTGYGGSGSYVWSSTTLPAGLSINSSTGLISGTPTTAGTSSATISIGDASGGGTVSRVEAITVNPFAITDSAQLPQATANAAYSHQFQAPSCGTSCAWTVIGSLPGGFTLSAAGLLSGTYTSTAGTISTFTIQAAGSAGTVQKQFTLIVLPTVVSGLSITTNITTSVVQGTVVTTALTASGGTPPYTFTLASGTLPAGVSLLGPGETIGNLSPGYTYFAGRPEVAGTYNFNIKVTDAASNTAIKAFSWQVSPLEILYTSLPITSPVSNPLILNQAYSQQMLVIGGTGNYTSWTTAAPIYPGLSLNSSTGLISGTPTNTGANSTLWTITDSGNNSISTFVSISAASNSTTTISLGGPANGTIAPLGQYTVYQVNPSGGTAPYTLSAVGSLPAGFALLAGNAQTTTNASGSAYELQVLPENPGTYTVTLQATDANNVTGERTYTIVVPGFSYPYTSALNDASVGVAYSQAIYSFDSTSTLTVSAAPGSALPPGLSVSTGGVLSGTPTAAGTYTFSLTFSDSSGTYTQSFQLRVSSIAITNPSVLQTGVVGTPYMYQMASTGGLAAVTWTASGLPSGLTISPAGLISGTPSTASSYSVTVTATDGVIPVTGYFALYVRAPNASQLSVSTAQLPDAFVNKQYLYNFNPSGGVGPYTVATQEGSMLPPGLSLVPSASIPGAAPGGFYLFGSPTTAGTYSFTLMIGDSAGFTIYVGFSLNVRTVTTVTGNPPNAIIGNPYTSQLTGIGGTAPYTFAMSQSLIGQETLPPGLTMSAGGLISGTPASTGNYVFNLTVTDSLGSTSTRQMSLLCTNSSGLYVSSIDFPYLGVGIGAQQGFSVAGTGSSNAFTWSVVGGQLPPGTFLRTASGTTNLGGQATSPGAYTFTLRATQSNNSANFADHVFNQTVGAAQIVTPADEDVATLYLPPAVIGTSYSQALKAAGGSPPYTFAESPFNADLLPPGLSLNSTGVISGTPTTAGVYFIRPLITDSTGNVRTSFAYQLVVTTSGPAPLQGRSFNVANNASVGTPYVFALDRVLSGGTAPYTWTASGLPAGLALVPGGNGLGSYITGIPTTAGTYNATLTVADSGSQTLTSQITLIVSPLAVTPGSVPPGKVGNAYSATLTASGGTAPYTFSLASVSDLPPGLALSASGVLSGNPTNAGNFVLSIVVTDNASNTLSRYFEITIDDAAGEAPALGIAPKPINITWSPGMAAPSASLSVFSSSGALTFNDLVTGIPGASLTATSGTTPASSTLNFNTSGLTMGTYSGLVAANSSGSANYGEAVPVTLTVTAPGACNTTLTSSANPSAFGQSITLTGSISCIGGTGTITFLDGSNTLGSMTIASGSASFTTSALAVGSHSLTAVYSGDSTFAGSTSAVLTQSVGQAATTTSLTSSQNPSTFGQNVTLTATVSVSTATGTVTFKDGSTTLGSSGVSGGAAAFMTTALSVGTHSLTAVYSGDTNNVGSTSSALSQTINQASTTISLTSSVNPSTFGQTVALTATVSPSTATGSVTFVDGSTTLATVALSGGTASLNTTSLAVGSHSLTARYTGDANDTGSLSSAVSQTVIQATTNVNLISSLNPSAYGAPVTLTALLTPSNATGTVNFLNGEVSLGSATVNNGAATLTLTNLPVGTDFLAASYSGDANDAANQGSLTQTITQGTATVSLASTPNPAVGGQTVTVTATVFPPSATGSITFKDGSNTIATVELSGGTASTTTSNLSIGSHNLTANYSGDANFLSAFSALGPSLNFTTAVPGTILDSTGKGTGFTARLPGTGGSIAANDPNLTLNTGNGTLTWLTTQVDPNFQVNVATGDFLAIPLSAAGVTLNEDFTFSATFNNLQYGSNADQMGVFVGTSSSNLFRGGLLDNGSGQAYTVSNTSGVDTNIQTSSLLAPSPGDTVTFTMSRTSGIWALTVQNLTNPAKSGIVPISQPTFLNGVMGLYAGVFAANSGTTNVQTETLSSFTLGAAPEVVTPPVTTTTLTSSANPSTFGQLITLTATVSNSSATGMVTFMDGSTSLGSSGLTSGVATLTAAALAVGTHSLTAVYSGDANNAGSTSTALSQTVAQAAATVSLMSTANPTVFGQILTLTATVSPSTATGSVAFFDGSTSLGNLALSGGTASFAISALSVGSHSLTARYSGDANDAAATSTVLTQVVNQANSSTVLTSSQNPSPFGAAVTLTATISPSAATGTVTFRDGSTSLGSSTVANGVATLTASSLAGGSHSLTAVYSGDANDNSSVSSALTQTVTQGTATLTLANTPNPAVMGQTVTLTATVAPSSATGTITFNDGSTQLATVTLNGGTATTTTSALSIGVHSLSASYSGDSNYASAASNPGPVLNFTSAVAGTILDATGKGTGFTTRLPGTGGSIPSKDPNLTLNTGSGSLSWKTVAVDLNGQANVANGDFFGFPLSAAGVTLNQDFSFSATFNNLQFGLSYDQIGLFVGTSGTNSFRGGELFTGVSTGYTASNITGADTNVQTSTTIAPNLGDTVVFTLSRTSGLWAFTMQDVTTPSKSGSIPITQPTFLNGASGLIAGVYASNAGNATTRTETLTSFSFGGGSETVTSPATTTTLTSSANPASQGQSVTLTATVSPSSATGTVNFLDGSAIIGTGTLSGGTATYTTSALALGGHSLSAAYSGNGVYSASTSSVLMQTVVLNSTTTSLTSSLNPSSFGQNVVFTAAVSPSVATGTITFSDGSTQLGTATLANGTATFATAGLTAGSHSIAAAYSGSSGYSASMSSVLTQTVNLAATNITLTSSANPAIPGQSITLTARVNPTSATGTVTFKDSAAVIGSGTLSAGLASASAVLNSGAHSLTAVYSGDSNNQASTSGVLTETVSSPTLTIQTTSLPSGMVNQSYGPVIFQVTGGTGPYSWTASGLPNGLSMSSSGQLGGTPTTTFNGGIGITVTDTGSHATAATSLSLSITSTPLLLSGSGALGNFNQGAPISASFSASGGVPPYTWSVTGGGLSVDGNGHVTGTAGSPGNYSATLAVSDSVNASASRTLNFSSFGITTSGLPPGSTTSAYSASITAAGGTPPYSFTATGLPPGVTFSGNAFGGTPTAAGTYSVAVHASDGGGLSANAGYSITITGAAPLSVFSTSLSDATVGQPYNGSLSASGGVSPYTWSQSGGVLPAGLSLSSSGGISGMATTPGAYSLGVKVTDGQNSIAVGSVSIKVDPAPLTITNGATFPSGIAGVAYPTQLLMASGGMAPYTFSVTGSLPSGLALSGSQIAGTPTSPGSSGFTLKVTDSSMPALMGVLGVTLNVRPQAPDIVLASSSTSFSLTAGTTSPPSAATVGVTSSVIAQNLAFSATANVPWLTVTGGTTTPGVTSIALNGAALSLTAAGSPYSGTVSVVCTTSGCGGVPQTVAVTLVVTAPPPLISVGTNLLSFASLTSNPASQSASLSVANAGGGTLQIASISSDSAWLATSAAPTSILPGPGSSVNITVNPAGLAAGYYRGTVSFVSNGGNASTVVTLFISGSATMTLGPSGAQFTVPQGGVLGYNAGSFSVDASTGATIPYTATVVGTPWLSISGGSGTATAGAPGNIGYTIDPTAVANFAAGAYYGTIQVSGSGVVNSPQVFQVVVNVTPAATPVIPNPSPAGLVFVSAGTGIAPQTITVYASSRTPLPFQAAASSDSGQWLSISPQTGSASASAPGAVTVTATPAGLAPGAYRGLVSFTFGTAVQAVNVTLIVEPAQTQQPAISSVHPAASGPTCPNALLVPTETGLVSNFSAPAAWPVPLTVQLYDTCGSPVGNGQIVATFSNGDPLLPLTAVGNASGTYSGTWTPRAPSSSVTITAVVSAAGYPTAQVKIAGQTPPNSAPILAPNGAGDIFNPAVGAGLGPGNIIQIYGSSLASQTSTPAVLPLPTVVNGTMVIIGGVQSPLFYVSPGQINAQIPFGLAAGNQYQLLVSANGALTTPLPIQLNAGAPAILNFSSGAVVAQHLDGTLVTSASPAVPGEYIVIYSSGLGATDIAVATGAASPSNPPANVLNQPVLSLNGNNVGILFAGLTPGLVGLYQVNFQVPPTLTSGNYTLQLTQGGTSSNTTVLPVASTTAH